MSVCFLGGIQKAAADFQGPFAPHYGIELLLSADPRQVLTRQLVKPDMPSAIGKMDKGELDENSLQKTTKPSNKIKHQQLQTAKKR